MREAVLSGPAQQGEGLRTPFPATAGGETAGPWGELRLPLHQPPSPQLQAWALVPGLPSLLALCLPLLPLLPLQLWLLQLQGPGDSWGRGSPPSSWDQGAPCDLRPVFQPPLSS